MRKIVSELRIAGRDQNKVFVEIASSRKRSPADAMLKYRLGIGKGNAYVEFDVNDEELGSQHNPAIKDDEYFVAGTVDFTERDVERFFNF